MIRLVKLSADLGRSARCSVSAHPADQPGDTEVATGGEDSGAPRAGHGVLVVAARRTHSGHEVDRRLKPERDDEEDSDSHGEVRESAYGHPVTVISPPRRSGQDVPDCVGRRAELRSVSGQQMDTGRNSYTSVLPNGVDQRHWNR